MVKLKRLIEAEKARKLAQAEMSDRFLNSFFSHGIIPDQDMSGHKDYLQLHVKKMNLGNDHSFLLELTF